MTKWTIKKKANGINENNMNEIVSDIKDILNHSTIKLNNVKVEVETYTYGYDQHDGKYLYISAEYNDYTIVRLRRGLYNDAAYDLKCMFPPIKFSVKDDSDIQEQFQIIQAINKTLEELTQYLKMNGII